MRMILAALWFKLRFFITDKHETIQQYAERKWNGL